MSCEVSNNCAVFGEDCWNCKFAKGNGGVGDDSYLPYDRKIKHPQVLAENQARKDAKKAERKAEKRAQKATKDKEKVKLLKRANKVEQKVKQTLNSGRANRDGDLHTESLAIDTKLQSNVTNPTIKVEEFDKVQTDARRGGKEHGILIIENKDGRRFVVMSEQLFSELI
jgi:hypothetical protein